jgi:hypothetical protein
VPISVFREPQLLTFLAAARDDAAGQRTHLLVAADWCVDAGDEALAFGLRVLAEAGARPHWNSRYKGWRWLGAGRFVAPHHLPYSLLRLLTGEVYRQTNRFVHYSTYAAALATLARLVPDVLAKIREKGWKQEQIQKEKDQWL